MMWDVLGRQTKWPMTNVRNLALSQWHRLAEDPAHRCLVPLTEFCEWAPDRHDRGDGKPVRGEMWFTVTDQPIFAVAGFWQPTAKRAGFTTVTCDANELVALVHPKEMVTVLFEADWSAWLTCPLEQVVKLQEPYPAELMTVRGPVFPARRAGA